MTLDSRLSILDLDGCTPPLVYILLDHAIGVGEVLDFGREID